jgi:hypothetical protein
MNSMCAPPYLEAGTRARRSASSHLFSTPTVAHAIPAQGDHSKCPLLGVLLTNFCKSKVAQLNIGAWASAKLDGTTI